MVRRPGGSTELGSAVGRRLWLLAPVALLAAACSGGGLAESRPPPAPAGDETRLSTPAADLATTTSALAAGPTVPADDLAATTAVAPLEGFSEVAAGSGLGPLDLAAASGGDPRERDALTRFRFRDGHARGFVNGGEENVVTVLRFASPADAEAYLQDTIDSSLVSNGSFLFTVAVPGATGYREQGAGKDGEPYVTYGALFTRGDRCFEQLVRSPAAGPERSEADAAALARRQADRVGG